MRAEAPKISRQRPQSPLPEPLGYSHLTTENMVQVMAPIIQTTDLMAAMDLMDRMLLPTAGLTTEVSAVMVMMDSLDDQAIIAQVMEVMVDTVTVAMKGMGMVVMEATTQIKDMAVATEDMAVATEDMAVAMEVMGMKDMATTMEDMAAVTEDMAVVTEDMVIIMEDTVVDMEATEATVTVATETEAMRTVDTAAVMEDTAVDTEDTAIEGTKEVTEDTVVTGATEVLTATATETLEDMGVTTDSTTVVAMGDTEEVSTMATPLATKAEHLKQQTLKTIPVNYNKGGQSRHFPTVIILLITLTTLQNFELKVHYSTTQSIRLIK